MPLPPLNLDVNASSTLTSTHSTGASVGAFGPAPVPPGSAAQSYTPLFLGLATLALLFGLGWLAFRKG